jgi:hypothetical protein
MAAFFDHNLAVSSSVFSTFLSLSAIIDNLLVNSLGLWLQAVIEGKVATFKLRPRFIDDIENIHLAHFAFRRDQIREYLSRNCPEL